MSSKDLIEMGNPLLEKEVDLNKSGGVVPNDSIVTQFLKRFFAVSPLLAMSFSTMNQIFACAKSITSQSSSSQHYNRYTEVVSNGEHSYFTCQYGNADAVVTYCPYDGNGGYQATVAMWSVYFGIFMLVRILATIQFATNDLRFYVAIDRYNGHLLNKVLVAIGFFLTFVSVCIGLYYLVPWDADEEWNSAVDTTSVLNMVLFVGINVLALTGFLKMSTGSPHHATVTSMDDFPQAIPIRPRSGINAVFSSVEGTVKPILVSYMLYLVDRDASLLQEYGQPAQLVDAMNKLYKPVRK